jgi:aminocarboxymuconate-semialdehyde decarboxylase
VSPDRTVTRAPAIDVHTHFVPRGLVERLATGGGDWGMSAELDGSGPSAIILPASSGYLLPGRLAVTPAHHDLAVRRREMALRGVDVQVLSAPTYLYRYDLAPDLAGPYVRAFNDALLDELRRGGSEFWGLALLPLQHPEEAVREVDRLAPFREVLGVAVGTRVGSLDLDHESLRPVWSALERNRMPVLVHPNHTDGIDRMREHLLTHLVGLPGETALAAARLILSGRLDEVTDLRLCLAHAGGSFPLVLGRIEAAFHRMELGADCARSPAEYVDRLLVDSVVHGVPAGRLVLDVLGPERVLLGSDYPARTGLEDPLSALGLLGLDRAAEDAIRGGNALRLQRERLDAIAD